MGSGIKRWMYIVGLIYIYIIFGCHLILVDVYSWVSPWSI